MNKREIQKIISFTKEVSELPDELLTDNDSSAFTSDNKTEAAQKVVYEKQAILFDRVKDIKIRLIAYFRAVNGESSTYTNMLGDITFYPKHFIVNTIHFENNKAWLDDKTRLLNLLKMAKAEFEEKARLAEENPENSIGHYFKTKEAKGIILAAILTLITGIATKDYWFEKVFSSTPTSKTNISEVDSLASIDKTTVIGMTTQEIFTKYYQTIKTLRKEYASVSAEGYIKDYIKDETSNIEARILSKSYIHRFATHEKLWSDYDYSEVADLIRARTINRIKEISEDVESRAKGAFTVTDDKLEILEEQVKAEIKN